MTRQDSIRSKGLEQHLNDTAGQHNDRGYAEFVRLINDGDEFGEKVSLRKLARLFKTTRPTIEKWVMLFEEETKDEA